MGFDWLHNHVVVVMDDTYDYIFVVVDVMFWHSEVNFLMMNKHAFVKKRSMWGNLVRRGLLWKVSNKVIF
jgi:hypothetical protein